ncbi:unnamed protein product [Mytilus edulis]|uniref:Uncharacterized protein n=1 Tax=Mytilus edulis TaxID=6550 RepID=A0A8S3SUU2_MYTED|nr:unnamed protein product [Mytilus edulis]
MTRRVKHIQTRDTEFCFEDEEEYYQQVTAGDFAIEFKDISALCSKHGSITEYFDASGDHEEADTRVWLHAVTSSAINIIIYSPDTDVYFIGLPLLKNLKLLLIWGSTRIRLDLSKMQLEKPEDAWQKGLTSTSKDHATEVDVLVNGISINRERIAFWIGNRRAKQKRGGYGVDSTKRRMIVIGPTEYSLFLQQFKRGKCRIV